MSTVHYLTSKKAIIWDFDGVVKESNAIKANGYSKLFMDYSQKLQDKINQHHIDNQGLSRLKKIPLYLDWVGEKKNTLLEQEYLSLYSKNVIKEVINAPWVPGVHEYLVTNHDVQKFYLVTGTPKDEIELILKELNIDNFFLEVYGAPADKTNTIASIIKKNKLFL